MAILAECRDVSVRFLQNDWGGFLSSPGPVDTKSPCSDFDMPHGDSHIELLELDQAEHIVIALVLMHDEV